MARCLIVDDEPIAQQIVEQYILQTPGLTLVAKSRNAMEAFSKLEHHAIDLIFLDIEMPLINGLSFLKALSNPPKIIFTTAYPDYAVQAFDMDVVDYLLKPFSYERFLKAVSKVKLDVASPIESESATGHLLIKEKGGLIKVPYRNILYIQAAKDYAKVVTDEKQHLVNFTMKSLEEILPPAKFIRIHKSYIVAIDQIRAIKAEEVVLSKDRVLPLSVNYKESLLKIYKH